VCAGACTCVFARILSFARIVFHEDIERERERKSAREHESESASNSKIVSKNASE